MPPIHTQKTCTKHMQCWNYTNLMHTLEIFILRIRSCLMHPRSVEFVTDMLKIIWHTCYGTVMPMLWNNGGGIAGHDLLVRGGGEQKEKPQQNPTNHSVLLTTHRYFGKWHTISTLFFSSFYISSVCHFSALKPAAANQVAELLEFILLLLLSKKISGLKQQGKFAILENHVYSTCVKNLTSPKDTKHTRLLADFFLSKQYCMLTYPGFKYSINCAYRDI